MPSRASATSASSIHVPPGGGASSSNASSPSPPSSSSLSSGISPPVPVASSYSTSSSNTRSLDELSSGCSSRTGYRSMRLTAAAASSGTWALTTRSRMYPWGRDDSWRSTSAVRRMRLQRSPCSRLVRAVSSSQLMPSAHASTRLAVLMSTGMLRSINSFSWSSLSLSAWSSSSDTASISADDGRTLMSEALREKSLVTACMRPANCDGLRRSMTGSQHTTWPSHSSLAALR
mmetsp:Transcript_1615/g.4412  ORF Transcript_1615/g.4412 Transcript_1615/m.4412 type:complete len:232 (+) Transcript_1615:1358-2053(+)